MLGLAVARLDAPQQSRTVSNLDGQPRPGVGFQEQRPVTAVHDDMTVVY